MGLGWGCGRFGFGLTFPEFVDDLVVAGVGADFGGVAGTDVVVAVGGPGAEDAGFGEGGLESGDGVAGEKEFVDEEFLVGRQAGFAVEGDEDIADVAKVSVIVGIWGNVERGGEIGEDVVDGGHEKSPQGWRYVPIN